MKKLLVLMMILGLASSANAIVLQISVNGDPDPLDSEIYVVQSEEVVLDIHCPSGQNPTGDDVYFALVVDTTVANITGGVVLKPPAGGMSGMLGQDAAAAYWPGLLANETGPWGSFTVAPDETAAPGMYGDDFIFHCIVPEGDAVVRLLSTVGFATATVHDTLTIHQIPEPMTVALLGMGGLFLLRRRR